MNIQPDIPRQIEIIINKWLPVLENLEEDIISGRRNHQNRTVKEILGHLIDSASNNHQRIVRLQYNSSLDFPDYRQDNDLWIKIQDHNRNNWKNLVMTWKYFNFHLAFVIQNIEENTLAHSWTDFEGTKVSLEKMVQYYTVHLNLHLNEIEDLINF